MPAEYTYDYAIVRVVPRVERGEQINVGVILSCWTTTFWRRASSSIEARLLAFDPALDRRGDRAQSRDDPVICRGGSEAGPIGALPARGRFRWLVSPRSTIIQMSPVHTGRTHDPEAALERLLETMVRQGKAGEPVNLRTGEQISRMRGFRLQPEGCGCRHLALAISASRWC